MDSSQADKAIDSTGKKGEGLGSKLGGAAKVVGGAMLGMGTAIAGGGVALLGVAKNASTVSDRVDKMSAKMGISKKGFQEWSYVMAQNGMDIDKMQVGMKTLVAQMGGAATGNKKSAASFKELGVSVTDSKGKLKDQEVMMNEVIMKLAQMPEGTEKARLATLLFGKSGVEMAPMLATGAKGIQDLKDRSHELGLVMSDEAVTAGVVFGDTMDDVTSSLGMVATNVGTAVMPIIQTFLDWLLSNMPMIQAVMSTVFGAIQSLVTGAVDVFSKYLMPTFQAIYDWVQVNWPMIQAVVSAAFDANKKSIQTVIDIFNLYLMPVFRAILDWVIINWPMIQATLQTAFDAIKRAVAIAVDVFNLYLLPAFRSIYDWAIANWPTIQATLQVAFDAIKAAVQTGIDIFNLYLMPAFRNVMAWVQENWPAIQATIVQVFDKIKEVWETTLKPALDAIVRFIVDTLVPKVKEWFPKIQAAVEAVFNAIKTVWDTILKPVLDAVWKFIENNLAPAFKTVFDGIKVVVETAFSAVGTAIDVVTGVFNGIKTVIDNVSTWFTNLKTGITSAIESARDAVGGAIDKIKSFFGFKFEWPKLNMPHFGISPAGWQIGDLLKGSIPKIGIDWYAKGGIFDKPTIFGSGSGLKGVGEAGPEAIMPISKLQQMIDWNNGQKQDRDVLLKILKVMQAIEQKDPSMILDTGVLVGAIKKPINREFGRDALLRERGI